ncbi:hypothetical protein CYMTET_16615, partial [Cymbomonas tetramitiformis]
MSTTLSSSCFLWSRTSAGRIKAKTRSLKRRQRQRPCCSQATTQNRQLHVLSANEADVLLRAREQGAATLSISLDLGLSMSTVGLESGGVVTEVSNELLLGWDDIEDIQKDLKGCYASLKGDDFTRVQAFSEITGRAVSLMPTQRDAPPTALVAGFPMHRFGKGVDPREDTERKMAAVRPVKKAAQVLDICTGLGYTAIAAATKGAHVTTIELDDAMQEMCRLNPWSQGLFDENMEIQQVMGDAVEVVKAFPPASFDRILHDPPTFALAVAVLGLRAVRGSGYVSSGGAEYVSSCGAGLRVSCGAGAACQLRCRGCVSVAVQLRVQWRCWDYVSIG